MKTLVAIPMKDPADAKTRLAPFLSPRERGHLALTLFDRALEFLAVTLPDADRLVVTASPSIAARSHAAGAKVLGEERGTGVNQAATAALLRAQATGYERLIVVPADIPVWLSREMQALLLSSTRHDVVIAAAHDGGTNALALDLRSVRDFSFSYGERSALAHAKAAAARGLRHATLCLPFLGRDIDTIDDCLVLEQWLLHAGVAADR